MEHKIITKFCSFWDIRFCLGTSCTPRPTRAYVTSSIMVSHTDIPATTHSVGQDHFATCHLEPSSSVSTQFQHSAQYCSHRALISLHFKRSQGRLLCLNISIGTEHRRRNGRLTNSLIRTEVRQNTNSAKMSRTTKPLLPWRSWKAIFIF